ncbi:MAG: ABC transporter ATP-binding protein [Clostridiales Family XIII bacterium]|jgi:ABC-2 type transport system ATP-binding protein|nr:ABC transporter ATP-binding protein [Clostridiales Family XIII bacterium]
MIEVIGLDKRFDKLQALSALDLHVKKGSLYGLVGVNGSGKTTALKHITGILRGDAGTVRIDGAEVYENPEVKGRVSFIPDDLYFFNTYSLKSSAKFYSRIYKQWDWECYNGMLSHFKLDEKLKLSRFSKGMQKQAAFILAMSSTPDCLVLDEPIDGLDPLARKLVWKYIVDGVADRSMTVLVSSHNLREMEGVCDSIGILDKGSMVIERDLDELKSDIHKIQVAFPQEIPENQRHEGLNVLHTERRGAVELMIVRNPKEVAETLIKRHSPLIFDILPLTLEEIFIYEMGGTGHELNKILL